MLIKEFSPVCSQHTMIQVVIDPGNMALDAHSSVLTSTAEPVVLCGEHLQKVDNFRLLVYSDRPRTCLARSYSTSTGEYSLVEVVVGDDDDDGGRWDCQRCWQSLVPFPDLGWPCTPGRCCPCQG